MLGQKQYICLGRTVRGIDWCSDTIIAQGVALVAETSDKLKDVRRCMAIGPAEIFVHFDVQNWTPTFQQLGCPLEYMQFGSFDVAFDDSNRAMRPRLHEFIEGDAGHN